MSTRILHCGESIENYNICVSDNVIGFTKRVAEVGDTVYLAVKSEGVTYCGVRGKLVAVTDKKPWDNADNYVQAFKFDNLEYCNPFPLTVLASIGGKAWGVKYMQLSKAIKDQEAVDLLHSEFTKNKSDIFHTYLDIENDVTTLDDIDEEIINTEEDEISIMGTFVTRKFYSEQHKTMGLETLVNKNFYNLFRDEYSIDSSILMSDNRMFSTATIKNSKTNKNITGISGIPDALLINYNNDLNNPLEINLIEYECYGLSTDKPIQKFNYLNGHIIPQLMRFASAFSVVTDNRIREKTIDSWMSKIIDTIFDNDYLSEKVSKWVKHLYPEINEQKISVTFQKMLHYAFKGHLKIILIIDELTSEQKETIKNVINSFKLSSENSVEFVGYVVRLEQRMNILDNNAEYALSIQK